MANKPGYGQLTIFDFAKAKTKLLEKPIKPRVYDWSNAKTGWDAVRVNPTVESYKQMLQMKLKVWIDK